MNMKKKIFKKHTKLFEDNIGGLLGNDGETLYIWLYNKIFKSSCKIELKDKFILKSMHMSSLQKVQEKCMLLKLWPLLILLGNCGLPNFYLSSIMMRDELRLWL